MRYLCVSLAELPALNRARAKADPDFDPIRSDPAFAELLQSVVKVQHRTETRREQSCVRSVQGATRENTGSI